MRWRTLHRRKRRASKPLDWCTLADHFDKVSKAAFETAPRLVKLAQSFREVVQVIAQMAATATIAEVAREIANRQAVK
jgi:hypothetical protein